MSTFFVIRCDVVVRSIFGREKVCQKNITYKHEDDAKEHAWIHGWKYNPETGEATCAKHIEDMRIMRMRMQ